MVRNLKAFALYATMGVISVGVIILVLIAHCVIWAIDKIED